MRSPQAPARPKGPRRRRREYDPEALIAAGKWSPEQQAKISKVMEEFKAGTLEDGHGGRVTSKKQALAIALSKARELTAAGAWDESKHPRHERGKREGGRFAPAHGGPDAPSLNQGERMVSDKEYDGVVEETADKIISVVDDRVAELETDGELTDEQMGEAWKEQLDSLVYEGSGEYLDMVDEGADAVGLDMTDVESEDSAYNRFDADVVARLRSKVPAADAYFGGMREIPPARTPEGEAFKSIEAYAKEYTDKGWQPVDSEPGEWLTLEDPKTGERVTVTETGLDYTEDEDAFAGSALTAAAAGLAPITPPKSWFDKPDLEGPTPMTVTADGQIYGHAALWGTCHTGMPGVCRTPPRSESGYRFFHLGEVETDGGPVHVGRVTMDTGHAPLTASREGTIRHYDDTGTGAAHVRAYEDEHGIVLAGALVPDIPAEKARRLKGATVSGDWRSIGGKLELVGMLAVNVPGFPVPRAMAASLVVEDEPHTMALVAAGMYRSPEDEKRKLKALTARALGGIDGLVSAAGVRPVQERRMGVTAAIPGAAPPVES